MQLEQEHTLQSSQMLDQTTAAKVGELVGAQALIVGEVISANAQNGVYREDREKMSSKRQRGEMFRV